MDQDDAKAGTHRSYLGNHAVFFQQQGPEIGSCPTGCQDCERNTMMDRIMGLITLFDAKPDAIDAHPKYIPCTGVVIIYS